MNIAVLGTGMVGRVIAARLAELGHHVTIGTRDPETTRARTEPDGMGNPPYSEWESGHADIGLGTFADAAASAEIVFNATSGAVSLQVLGLAGEANLDGKILVDIANPLDYSSMPPTLLVVNTDSLGEQIQRTFPGVRVVKALNTLNANLMVHPDLLPEATSVFVCGDDADAKATVTGLLASFGHTDVIDLGDITNARGPEMLLPIWVRIWGALGTPMFNFKIVR
jgi:8-hydroxy-5-deazaflavin:NADPH oxidoreductase